MKKFRFVIGIAGASGSIYGRLLLEKIIAMRDQIDNCGVIFSDNARTVWKFELDQDPGTINFPEWMKVYDPGDFFAPMASGSAAYDGMIICPCTLGTLGRIASGVSGDLLTRAADVMLKERKKLILVPRETPLNLIHLSNMKSLTEAGAIICPASPSFYSKPVTLEQAAMTVVDRVLVLAGFQVPAYQWGK
ncbi:MAG: UbiX family flavin prenyltransferase [Bacteroidales bacterium]|nr:UbiX family flavin prenyltransferase [Bacteroidales bacterium]